MNSYPPSACGGADALATSFSASYAGVIAFIAAGFVDLRVLASVAVVIPAAMLGLLVAGQLFRRMSREALARIFHR